MTTEAALPAEAVAAPSGRVRWAGCGLLFLAVAAWMHRRRIFLKV